MNTYAIFAVILIISVAGFVFVQNRTDTSSSIEGDYTAVKNTENNTNSGDTNKADDASSDTELHLSGKGLTTVSQSVFQNTKVTLLDLSNNSLSGSLPGEVRFLTSLKVLNLSGNTFTGVPAEIGQLSNLEILNLSNNQITGLPNELGNLKKLKVLDLRNTSYSAQDLEEIVKGLPKNVEILTN